MSQTIEEILSAPDKQKETEHGIILAMSKDINRGFLDLKKAVSGGWPKPNKKQQKWALVIKFQLTTTAQEREQSRATKRAA